jgi:hypothetical protein
MRVPIPDDWSEEENGYTLALVCIPDSQLWRSLVRGKIQELARGRVYDETTGSIKQAQTVGWAIYDSFMTCKLDDLVTAIETINITLSGLDNTATTEKVVFELARINYNLDRIRDNLDSHAPDGNENTEYGLATILAALGPNVTKSTEFIKAIKEALNTNIVGFPDESGEFAEGISPALPDAMGEMTSMQVSTLPLNRIKITIDTNGLPTPVKLMYARSGSKSLALLEEVMIYGTDQVINYDLADMPGANGYILAVDHKMNIFADNY